MITEDLLNFEKVSKGTYTPTIAWSTTGSPTVANVSFYYYQIGKLLMIRGRFNITELNAPSTNGALRISLPTGFTTLLDVGGTGDLYTPNSSYMIRNNVAGIIDCCTPSGGAISKSLQTGWYGVYAILPLE